MKTPTKRRKPARKAAKPAKAVRKPLAAKSGAVSTGGSLGQVRQILIERNGKSFVHTFSGCTSLLKTSHAGVLVITGRFAVDAKGFIR